MTSLKDETVLTIRRHFKAPPEEVFAAWTDREQWQAWIGPRGVECSVAEHDARPGGIFRLTMVAPDGRIFPTAGIFKTIQPPETLIFTWGREGDPAQQSLISLSFRPDGKGTEMVLRQEGLPSEESRESHRGGWNSAFDKLQEYVE